MGRLTVCQVLPGLVSGGVERGTLEVARALVAEGHRSIVVSGGGPMVDQLLAEGSEHAVLPVGAKSPRVLLQVHPLRRFLVEQGVHLVHARSRMPAWACWLALHGIKPGKRPRWVTTVHGLYSVSRYSAIMTSGERVIAVSDTVRDYIRRSYPAVPDTRIEVIPRGIDPAEFPRGYHPDKTWLDRWHTEFPHLANRQLITLPGRLTRLKGHEDLLDLTKRLVTTGLPVHALVVGGEDARRKGYAKELRHRVRANGLDAHLTFAGHRNDVREIYAVSTVVLSLSRQPESFGRTVLEAIALGVPVIGYDHGGVGELLAQLFPQGRVTVGDVPGLAARTAALLKHPARPDPLAGYTLDEMLGRTLALYRNLAACR